MELSDNLSIAVCYHDVPQQYNHQYVVDTLNSFCCLMLCIRGQLIHRLQRYTFNVPLVLKLCEEYNATTI